MLNSSFGNCGSREFDGPILVTGVAGFIGFHLAKRLLEDGEFVVGLDNLGDYYDPKLKMARIKKLLAFDRFRFLQCDISDAGLVANVFEKSLPQYVFHLAAQAGVRYSIENPAAYTSSNLVGFANVLESSRKNGVRHFVYASSSSVYGLEMPPFTTRENSDHPISYYAATKKANEVMAHSYSHLFGLPTTGLRFFTVYGPWGRPDMAMWLFAKAIMSGDPIQLFNNGQMLRDFTFIDDIVESIVRVAKLAPSPNPEWATGERRIDRSSAPWRIYNIGNSRPLPLLRLVTSLEACLGRKAEKILSPMQPGDVVATEADVSDLEAETSFRPNIVFEEGVRQFCEWFLWWRSEGESAASHLLPNDCERWP
jgi:UDP-glucuronate 4-epimerase